MRHLPSIVATAFILVFGINQNAQGLSELTAAGIDTLLIEDISDGVPGVSVFVANSEVEFFADRKSVV